MTTVVRTKRVDVDTHFLPRLDFKELRKLIPRNLSETERDMIWREAWRIADPRGVRAELKGLPAPGAELAGDDPHRDPAARAKAMEGLGFDMQVLIADGPYMNLYGGNPSGTNPPLAARLALCRLYNNTVAEAQHRFPERFIGAAIVPFGDVDASTEEARRAVTELGLRAVIIPGNWLGQNLDAVELFPFWEVMDANRATALVHHVPQGCLGAIGDHVPRYPMVGMERMRRLHLGTYLGFGLEYAMASAALTIGGVVDEFSNLKFCFFEAGGSWLPYAMYGTDRSFLIEPQCARTQTLPSELMKKHCFSAVEPMERVEELVGSIGSENYFFGTDFPHPEFETFQTNSTSIQDRAGLSEQDKVNILGGNITRVLGLN